MRKFHFLMYWVLSLGILSSCGHVFYYPEKRIYWIPSHFHVESQEIWLHTRDGVKLHGLHLLTDKNSTEKKLGTILFFHGNAENLSTHFVQWNWILKHGYEVIIFDYRGYGNSEGEPDQEGTYLDALAFLNYAYQYHQKQGNKKLIIHGQSLGGVIAMRALADFKHLDQVDLFVPDSTFRSYQDVAFDKMTSFWPTFIFSPLAYLFISDKMAVETEHLDKIAKSTKILVIHGTEDYAVPYHFGSDIFEKLKNKEKHHFWTIQSGRHIDIFLREQGKWQQTYLKFLNEL